MRFVMKKARDFGKIYWIIFVLWTGCALGLLTLGLLSYSGVTAGETATMLGERRMAVYMGMTILGFPINLLVTSLLSDLLKPLGYDLFSVSHSSSALFIRDWGILTFLGWLQWFVVFPAVVRWFTRNSKNVTSESG
jgi:hypothetical protein